MENGWIELTKLEADGEMTLVMLVPNGMIVRTDLCDTVGENVTTSSIYIPCGDQGAIQHWIEERK